jgi:[acyl-carrier-protein] S-malonyltransferase
MGQAFAEAFPEAARVFEEADSVLGFELSRLCFVGPEAELQLTANTQPALLTTSLAIFRVLEQHRYDAAIMAGHSLGEYSALVAAQALSFADALLLVRRRGEAMQAAVPVGVGAMAAVLGLEADALERVVAGAAAESAGVCEVANLNAPGQTVIAGNRQAVERAIVLAREAGARRAVSLPVSAPFHCSLMAPARRQMEPLLRATSFAAPRVPVVCNADAAPVETGAAAREALIRQIDSPVRWVESVSYMAEQAGIEEFVEVGPGEVLSGLVRRIAPSTSRFGVAEPAALEKLVC